MRPRLYARFLFAAIGAAACLAAALGLEAFYSARHTSAWLDHPETPLLLFLFHRRTDTEQRLASANAKTGDVEVTLTWNNLNDLDLHVFDPNGQHIFFLQKVSNKTEGVLDVDQNSVPPYKDHPVEHIYWPSGRAPAGTYRVYVDHYLVHGGSDPTDYTVTVKANGRVSPPFHGSISQSEHIEGQPGRLVCEFTAGRPALIPFGPPAVFWRALLVTAIWAAAIAVALCAGLLLGLWLFYRRIYRKRFMTAGTAARIVLPAAAWSALAGALGQAIYSVLPDALMSQPPAAHAVGMALIAGLIGLALGGSVPHLRRGWACVAGLLGGALAGFLLVQIYLGLHESLRSEMWGRAAAAAIIGAAIGFVVALIVETPIEPPKPVEFEDSTLRGMQPLSLRANRIGPSGKLRRASHDPANR